MTKFKLEFDVDSDFYRLADDPEAIDHLAVTMTLKDVIRQITDGHESHGIRDENGNKVGSWSFEEDLEEVSEELAQFYADIIITAVEGGIGSWCLVEDYRWNAPAVVVGARIVELYEPTEQAKIPANINFMTIHKAYEAIERGDGCGVHSSYLKNFVGAKTTLDAGDIDADDASCLVQIGLWGDVIYS